MKTKWNTVVLPKETVNKDGWHCLKCWERDTEGYLTTKDIDLQLKEADYSQSVEYWVCPECDTEYQVDIEIERDFLEMTEVTNENL